MKKVVKIYKSFEEEALADSQRRSAMSISERLQEFAVLQERVWGDAWSKSSMEKRVSFEQLEWAQTK